MLTIFGTKRHAAGHCDGIARRDFLAVGGMMLGGLTLPELLRAEAQSGVGTSHKAVINVFLPGGPPHIDMFDLKPAAPVEIRGEFHPIRTNVPGIDICEHFPRVARMADKFVFIRTMADCDGGHDAYQCMTGRKKNAQQANYWPALGGWISHQQGPVNQSVPAHCSLMYPTGEPRWGDPGTGGFLGMAHNPFRLVGRDVSRRPAGLTLNVPLERLQDRVGLLRGFDQMNRDVDRTGALEGIDAFSRQAMGILTSSRLMDALDLSREDPRILARYGANDPAYVRDGAPRMVRNFCVARRLVEAGARVVTLNFSRWDWHGGDGRNFVEGRANMPLLDQAVSALVTDLHERGLDRDVSVVVWGEFGRTPRVNNTAGRDHWPQVSFALLAGGGMRTGQVIGTTNRFAEHPVRRPVKFQEVFATLYHNLGINLRSARVFDPSGRPQYLVDPDMHPLREVV